MERDSDLEAFLRTFRAEGEKELKDIKEKAEEEIADIIALKRLEVESQVRKIREENEEKALKYKKKLELKLHQEILKKIEIMQEELLSKVIKKIEHRLDKLKSSPHYSQVIDFLLDELVQEMGPGAVFYVPQSEAKRLSDSGLCVLPFDFKGPWGGCRAVDEESKAVLENTFHVRLERLLPDIAREIAGLGTWEL